MVAEVEVATLERVGRQLADRLEAMRAALLRLQRTSTDARTRQLAHDALARDDAADLGVDYRPPAYEVSGVLCIRCATRDRSAGSLWCWACEPHRPTAQHGRD